VPLWLNIVIMTDPAAEVLALTRRLLDAIAAGDWPTYEELCAPDLTAFEPEACGQLVEGLAFHRFYFDLPARPAHRQTTLAAPRVRVLGDVAVVTYVRLNQRAGPDGVPHEAAFAETRVWQRQDGRWRHVHFHRSVVSR
jgi:calcium/calmodulin-dependent protein kinase (CaM kinase) II